MDVVKGESAPEPAVDEGRLPSPQANEDATGKIRLPITDPNWQWQIFDQFEDKSGDEQLKERKPIDAKEDWEGSPFRLVHRQQKCGLWPDEVRIILSSRPLIKILQEYLPDHGDLKSMDEPPVAGRELFLVLDSLKNHRTGSLSRKRAEGALEDNLSLDAAGGFKYRVIDNGNTSVEVPPELSADGSMKAGELHLRHLVRCLEEEYKDTLVRARRMGKEMRATWDMLWAFFPTGSKVVYQCEHSQELLCAVVSPNTCNYMSSHSIYDKIVYLSIELEVCDYNGLHYGKCTTHRTVEQYKGEKSFRDLSVCPFELMEPPQRQRLEETFLANGRMFYDLAVKHKNRFMHYAGHMFRLERDGDDWILTKQRADGRVMIDLASFAKMNPRYYLGNAQPPSVSISNGARNIPSPSSRRNRAPSKLVPLLSAVSDKDLIFAPAIVYGFSFALKQWGSFAVTRFQEIRFAENAFKELTMEKEMKDLLYKLVSQYVATPSDSKKWARVDPIPCKGEGCVLLCYGPPGSGKTLTAESVAEKLERPLWAVNVSELGNSQGTSGRLEQNLTKVLEIASTWRAVLLLDEADTYLEQRETGDMARHIMAGVFLRLLEYYQGVLFLTTNRVWSFDEAFRSRISMFLHYKPLEASDRAKVWLTLLKRGEVEGVTVEFCEEVARQELNGRVIRNVIHMAQVFASSSNEPVAVQHVRYILGKTVASTMELLNNIKLEIETNSVP